MRPNRYWKGPCVAGLFIALAVISAAHVYAQGNTRPVTRQSGKFPEKPVRIIVPLAPGGGSDIVGRIVALALTDEWGQAVVVDNRPGAGSTVGTSMAAKAAADGYTLLISSSSIAITPALYKNLDFDIRRDFVGVTLIASQPSILAVHASVAANSVKDLISLAKTQSGKLAYGSAGIGSATHLGAELFRYSAGIDLLHVPYKSAGQATTALLSGEVHVLLTNMASVLPYAKTGKIKLLAISSLKRSAIAPEIATVAESGLAGFEYATWYGMLAPAGTAKVIVERVHTTTAKIIRSPQVLERFSGQGLDVYGSAPAEFQTHLDAEITKWDKVVPAAGIRAE